jgi:hypothetical protein
METNQHMDRPTNEPTDEVSYRSLKIGEKYFFKLDSSQLGLEINILDHLRLF